MNRRQWLWLLGACVSVGALPCWRRFFSSRSGINPMGFLRTTDPTDGYAHAGTDQRFEFPKDHGPHNHFQHEWWYFTGNLRDQVGRPFGFQLTFFRFALSPEKINSSSAWATQDAMLGHFAVSDIEGGHFHAYQRTGRPVLGIAGMSADPARVWIRDWQARFQPQRTAGWQLEACHHNTQLHLDAVSHKAIVLQGQNGFSRKGPGNDNASYYYSMPRLQVAGNLVLEGKPFPVSGQAWMDHEWGTTTLSADTVGWDWFGLQLSDGCELTIYLLRREDGSYTPFSAGTWTNSEGISIPLCATDFMLSVTGHWRSSSTHVRYPAGWTLTVTSLGVSLSILPRLAGQEWHSPIRYWEGAVAITGTRAGNQLDGIGYVELTGY